MLMLNTCLYSVIVDIVNFRERICKHTETWNGHDIEQEYKSVLCTKVGRERPEVVLRHDSCLDWTANSHSWRLYVALWYRHPHCPRKPQVSHHTDYTWWFLFFYWISLIFKKIACKTIEREFLAWILISLAQTNKWRIQGYVVYLYVFMP